MAEVKRMGYCIDGEWKQSTSDKYISITDSSTGEVIAEVPSCTVEECEAAIASAQKAFESWSQLSMAKRVQYMFRWRDVLYAHKEELAVLCAKELGKTLNEARGDVQKAIEPTEEACAAPLLIQGGGAMQVTTGYDTTSYRFPLGVVTGVVLPRDDSVGVDGAARHRLRQHGRAQGEQPDAAHVHAHARTLLRGGGLPEGRR